jgi:hypothetical protein
MRKGCLSGFTTADQQKVAHALTSPLCHAGDESGCDDGVFPKPERLNSVIDRYGKENGRMSPASVPALLKRMRDPRSYANFRSA